MDCADPAMNWLASRGRSGSGVRLESRVDACCRFPVARKRKPITAPFVLYSVTESSILLVGTEQVNTSKFTALPCASAVPAHHLRIEH